MKHFYGFTVLLVFILSGCNNRPKTTEYTNPFMVEEETICIPYRYPPEDSIDVNLEKYIVKKTLHPVFDSIIHSVETCPEFDSSRAGFTLIHEISKGYPLVTISIVKYTWCYNTARDNAIFFHKGYNFYYEGGFIDAFFEKTSEFVQFKGVDMDKYTSDFTLNTPGFYWRYILKKKRLQNIGYNNCNGWWSDEKYKGVY
ncbi:hypothetical protein D0T87_23320 [Bacteroides sp. 51]|nr:hypothetical protein [Bacteroides sp. 51]